jgi:hypothetical protein
MIPYIDLYDAKKSLELAKETIKLMDDPSNYMLEAQKDMLELEVEHFCEQSKKFTVFLLTIAVFCSTLYYLCIKGIINVF